ncbi:MAG: hypothetical protein AAFZ65_02795 [Planctomycetota bacterium]
MLAPSLLLVFAPFVANPTSVGTPQAPAAQEGAPTEASAPAPNLELPCALPEEPMVFERVWKRYRTIGDDVRGDSEHRSILTVALDREDAEGNRVLDWQVAEGEWERFNTDGDRVDQAADKGVIELATGIDYEVRVSPKFRTVILEDLSAARAAADAGVERAVAQIEAERYFYAQKQRAVAIVKSAVLTEDLLELTLLREPKILLEPLGRNYRMGKRRPWQSYFLNPVGEEGLEANAWIEPLEHDPEANTLLVRVVRELDYDATRTRLEAQLAGLRRRLDQKNDAIVVDEMFELREETRTLLDLETGMPLWSEQRHWVRIYDDERLESVSFTRQGFEPSEALTGDWEAPTDAEG